MLQESVEDVLGGLDASFTGVSGPKSEGEAESPLNERQGLSKTKDGRDGGDFILDRDG
jgi:hypothetical protein